MRLTEEVSKALNHCPHLDRAGSSAMQRPCGSLVLRPLKELSDFPWFKTPRSRPADSSQPQYWSILSVNSQTAIAFSSKTGALRSELYFFERCLPRRPT